MASRHLRFIRSARIHKIGKASVLYVMEHTEPTDAVSKFGDAGLDWLGTDERGRELHIVAVVQSADDDGLLVIHVFPTALLRKDRP